VDFIPNGVKRICCEFPDGKFKPCDLHEVSLLSLFV
jgi:hypothetical protein